MRRYRRGEPRVIDDESGFSVPRSQTVKRWDGAIVAKSNNETRNPQEFVRARKDPEPLRDVRPRQELAEPKTTPFLVLGDGSIYYFDKPGSVSGHLVFPGIGEMKVGESLVVYPNDS